MKNKKFWHRMNYDAVIDELASDGANGLTSSEAAKRMREGKNNVWQIEEISQGAFGVNLFSSLTILLFLISLVVVAIFGYLKLAIVSFVILLVGLAFRIFAYGNAKRVFDKSAAASIPQVKVVRDGKLVQLPANMIVLGDIIILHAGDIVPCDARIIQADDLLVNESKVIPNNNLVTKTAERIVIRENLSVERWNNILFTASSVVSGECKAIACGIGEDTYVHIKYGKLIVSTDDNISFLKGIKDKIKTLNIVSTIAALLVCVFGILTYGSNAKIGDILVAALALGVVSLGDVVCSTIYYVIAKNIDDINKFATIKNISNVQRISNTKKYVLGSSKLLESEEFKLLNVSSGVSYIELADKTYYSLGIIPNQFGNSSNLIDEKIKYFFDFAHSTKSYDRGDVEMIKTCQTLGVGKDGLYKSIIHSYGEYSFVCTGSIEDVLSVCTLRADKGTNCILTEEYKERLINRANSQRVDLASVVAVCEKPLEDESSLSIDNMIFLGFFAVAKLPAQGLTKSISLVRESGGNLVLFSDDEAKDYQLGRVTGFITSKDIVVNAIDVLNAGYLGLEDGQNAIVVFPKFGNVIQMKQAIASMLSGNGDSVVLTSCDEDKFISVDDSITIASIPESGLVSNSYQLQSSADIILRDDGSGLVEGVEIVKRSRLILKNIESMMTYFKYSQIAKIVVALISSLFGTGFLNATMILFLGLIIDFFGMSAVAYGRVDASIMFEDFSKEKTMSYKDMFIYFFPCVLWGIVTAVFPALFAKAIDGITMAQMANSTFVSMLASSCVLGLYTYRIERIRGLKIAKIITLVLFIVISILAILLVGLTGFASVFAGEAIGGIYMLQSFASAVVILIMLIFIK